MPVGGTIVGGETVGSGIGVSKGGGCVGTGTGVDDSVGQEIGVSDAGGGVLVSTGIDVSVAFGTELSVGSPVPAGAGVAGLAAKPVLVCIGVRVSPDKETCGVRVGWASSRGGGTIKTSTSSMAVPAFSKVTGNRNQVIWESGSPVITDRGNDNLISQL